MSSDLPFVSIIIPTRPGQAEILAVNASRALDYPPDRREIIVARGRQPAVQRNLALRQARGDLIYFLDDDARPLPGNLRRAAEHFRRPEVKMAGGPSLCPPDAPWLEQVFAVVLASWLAFGPSRARYDAVGTVRPTGEKELILCNLIARRDALLDLGGFDESLYPNEENALMDELQRRGGTLLYDPELVVHRRPRPTLAAFYKMLLNYGRGRAEQFRLHPTAGSALNFVPPLLLLYLALLPVANFLSIRTRLFAGVDARTLWTVLNGPLFAYLAALLAQTAVSAATKGAVRSVAALPLVYCTHMLYGFGFWAGLFGKVKHAGKDFRAEVQLETLSV